MQDFFNDLSPLRYGVTKYGNWDYIREGLKRNLVKVQEHYATRVYAVKSQHYLIRLLQTINIPLSLPLDRYYDNVDTKANNLSMVMKMTSSIFRGYLFDGVFFGENSKEIILNDTSYFNLVQAGKDWKKIKAVKVVWSKRSDLDLLLPNGKKTGFEDSVSVISVNIPLLAVQYRAFMLDQMRKVEGRLSISHFIHMYVLPNMLDSLLDICLFNRFNNLLKGAPVGKSYYRHQFTLIDYSEFVDKAYYQAIKNLELRTMEYKHVLNAIPAVTKNDMEEVMVLPQSAPTKQVVWAELLARLEVVDSMSLLLGEKGIRANRAEINYFLRFFKQIKNDNSLLSYLPQDIYSDTNYLMNKLIERFQA